MASWMLPFFYVDNQGEMGSSFPVVMFLNLQPKPVSLPHRLVFPKTSYARRKGSPRVAWLMYCCSVGQV